MINVGLIGFGYWGNPGPGDDGGTDADHQHPVDVLPGLSRQIDKK